MKNFIHHNHVIQPSKAKQMVQSFQLGQPTGTIFGHITNKNAILQLMAQPEAEGILSYHALNDEGQNTLVSVAVRADGTVIDGIWVDESFPCPPLC